MQSVFLCITSTHNKAADELFAMVTGVRKSKCLNSQ